MTNFKELLIWKKSMLLTNICFELTDQATSIAPNDRYGLYAQIRKSAISVSSNIAEGAGRRSVKDFIHFLDMTRGSLNELETQILILQPRCKSDSLTKSYSTILSEIEELHKMLSGFIKAKESHL